MLWSEIKKWAKQRGYETVKQQENENTVYIWSKIDDPSVNGTSRSVTKLAKDIYNHITDNAWLDHQLNYRNLDQ